MRSARFSYAFTGKALFGIACFSAGILFNKAKASPQDLVHANELDQGSTVKPSHPVKSKSKGKPSSAEGNSRFLTKSIKEIANELGLAHRAFSSGWISQITNSKGDNRFIIGNLFDCNTQAAAAICSDKAALSDVFASNAVPHVEHKLFLSPSYSPSVSSYIPLEGVFKPLQEYALSHNYNVVLKPNKGSSGKNVFHCTDRKSVEAAALTIFNSSVYGLAACPYKEIEAEFRIMILNGEPRIFYKKERPHVIGDGVQTLKELIFNVAEQESNFSLEAVFSFLADKQITFNYIPIKDEKVLLGWQHNLSKGSSVSTDIEPEHRAEILDLALRAAKVINIKFASVDVIRVENKFLIIEINSGIMIKHAIEAIGEAKVKGLYKDAVCTMFHMSKSENSPTDSDSTDSVNLSTQAVL